MVEQSRGGLNAGYNHEIQYLLQKALIPAVEAGLRQAWGADWINKLDDRRAIVTDQGQRGGQDRRRQAGGSRKEPLGPMPRKEDGSVKWDTNTLLHTIREYGREMPNVQRSRAGLLKDWCFELRNLRNAPSHADPETFHQVNSDRNLIYQSAIAIKLLNAFNAKKEADELEALMDGPWAATRSTASRGSEAKEVPVKIEERVEEPTLLDREIEQTPPASVANEEMHSRRRTDLPAAGQGVCIFVLAGKNGALFDERESLASVKAEVLAAPPIQNFAVPTGATGNSATFYQIIRDTRGCEPSSPMLDMKTRVHLDTEFVGNSFGLAVVIADRSSRYGLAEEVANRRIVATGAVLAKHGGEVGAIDHFLDKLAVVQHFRTVIPAGSLFIFPRRNLETDDSRIVAALKQLEGSGIEHRAIAHVDDLNDLFPRLAGEKENGTKADPARPTNRSLPRPEADLPLEATGKVEVSSAQPGDSWKRYGTPFGFAASIALGLFLVGGVFYGTEYVSGKRIDVAAIQASDERLQALTQITDDMSSESLQARDCLALVAASQKLLPFDLERADDVQKKAAQEAQQCGSLIAESDQRLRSLRSSSKALVSTEPLTVQKLADARSAVTHFDEDRTDLQDLNRYLEDGNGALRLIRESEGRIDVFNRTISSWKRDETDGLAADEAMKAYRNLQPFDFARTGKIDANAKSTAAQLSDLLEKSDSRISQAIIIASISRQPTGAPASLDAQAKLDALTPFDMVRASALQRQAIGDGRKSLQEARWKTFEIAATNYTEKPSAENTHSILQAYNALPLSDRISKVSQLNSYRVAIDQAQQEILLSDERLAQLDRSYGDARKAEGENRSLAVAYEELASAVRSLSDLDRARLSAQQRAELQHGTRIVDELSASDQRIMKAISSSELALKMTDERSRRGLMDMVRSARGELTALDNERLSADQQGVLKSVCDMPIASAPPRTFSDADTLPAIANLDCYDEKDFETPMLPAIR